MYGWRSQSLQDDSNGIMQRMATEMVNTKSAVREFPELLYIYRIIQTIQLHQATDSIYIILFHWIGVFSQHLPLSQSAPLNKLECDEVCLNHKKRCLIFLAAICNFFRIFFFYIGIYQTSQSYKFLRIVIIFFQNYFKSTNQYELKRNIFFNEFQFRVQSSKF